MVWVKNDHLKHGFTNIVGIGGIFLPPPRGCGGYVFAGICLFVSKITPKAIHEF